MANTIYIRGTEYTPQAFSDLQLAPILSILSNITELHLDLEQQFQVGFLLKEVIFEDLPDDIVKVTKSGNCVLLLDIDELSKLASDLAELHAKRGAEKSRERGDTERAEKFERKQKAIANQELTEEEEKQALQQLEKFKQDILRKRAKI